MPQYEQAEHPSCHVPFSAADKLASKRTPDMAVKEATCIWVLYPYTASFIAALKSWWLGLPSLTPVALLPAGAATGAGGATRSDKPKGRPAGSCCTGSSTKLAVTGDQLPLNMMELITPAAH
jgi:hypothetical protein